VADVAEALSAERPYRPALSPDEVLATMRPDAGRRLDAAAFAALEQLLPDWSASRSSPRHRRQTVVTGAVTELPTPVSGAR
jgi:HD-GYP domain-containing protein (c-di-GMP phosphodiesterase class II)